MELCYVSRTGMNINDETIFSIKIHKGRIAPCCKEMLEGFIYIGVQAGIKRCCIEMLEGSIYIGVQPGISGKWN